MGMKLWDCVNMTLVFMYANFGRLQSTLCTVMQCVPIKLVRFCVASDRFGLISEMANNRKDQHLEIRFMHKLGLSAKAIHDRLLAVHGRQAVSRTTVQRWKIWFQNNDEVQDRPKSGHPKLRTPQKVNQVKQVIQRDQRTTVREAGRQCGVSATTAFRILKKDLGKKKKPSKWIPHFLNQAQRDRRVCLARAALQTLRRRRNPVSRVVAQDESWMFVWNPEDKRSSMVWLDPQEERPQKPPIERTTLKIMLVVFFDKDGVIYREFVPRGLGITGDLYRQILMRFLHAKALRSRHQCHETWSLLQDGAPAHNSRVAQGYLNQQGVEQIPHPGYSPDLNPCDFWFFRRVKQQIQGHRFRNIRDLTAAVDIAIGSIPRHEFRAAMDRYPERLRRCIAAQGKYFERS